ncbi:MAG: NUDIX hydrolase N-terminal domain-containing protein [Chloroflexota bacterium]
MSDISKQLTQVADQLRALSTNGLIYTDDPYQIERYQKIKKLSAQLLSIADSRPQHEIEHILFEDIAYKTPMSTVDTAVFDECGQILLIQRADSGKWALPGGACDVGEPPSTGAVREVWEETGYVASVSALLGVFDSFVWHDTTSSRHMYHFLFGGYVVGGEAKTSLETLDVRWFSADDAPWDTMSSTHPARIRHAFQWYTDRTTVAFFDPTDWTPSA